MTNGAQTDEGPEKAEQADSAPVDAAPANPDATPDKTEADSGSFSDLAMASPLGRNIRGLESLQRGGDLLGNRAAQVVLPDGTGMPLRQFLTTDQSMHLLWKSEAERAESLIFEFAQRGVAQQVIRWTGSYGSMGDKAELLPIVAEAFSGVKGFHMFGGTQIRDLDTGAVLPTIGEVPVALKRADRDLILIGVIPKVEEEPKYIDGIGIVLSVRETKGYFTVINGDQNIGLVLQPDVNGTYNWIDEIKESLRQCERLMAKKWSGTLNVFGGSPTRPDADELSNVDQEVRWWAKAARNNPEWDLNIVLFKGSGGVADVYANDPAWLAKNPAARVVDITKSDIRRQVQNIGLTTDWND